MTRQEKRLADYARADRYRVRLPQQSTPTTAAALKSLDTVIANLSQFLATWSSTK